MILLRQKNFILATPLLLSVALLVGCQPPHDSKQAIDAKSVSKDKSVPIIQAKVVPVKLDSNEVCAEEGCTHYDFQTIESNVKWIDDYFIQRLKKAEPAAFSGHSNSASAVIQRNNKGLNQSLNYVKYLGQNDHIASFAIQTYVYSAGAAHGMSHQEFVIFDLKTQKHITVADLVLKDKAPALLDELYSANQTWLDSHGISKEKLQMTDNFYYGVDGIVFVYPVYELASYAEGMTELILPYPVAKKYIQPQYLPSLPNYGD